MFGACSDWRYFCSHFRKSHCPRAGIDDEERNDRNQQRVAPAVNDIHAKSHESGQLGSECYGPTHTYGHITTSNSLRSNENHRDENYRKDVACYRLFSNACPTGSSFCVVHSIPNRARHQSVHFHVERKIREVSAASYTMKCR